MDNVLQYCRLHSRSCLLRHSTPRQRRCQLGRGHRQHQSRLIRSAGQEAPPSAPEAQFDSIDGPLRGLLPHRREVRHFQLHRREPFQKLRPCGQYPSREDTLTLPDPRLTHAHLPSSSSNATQPSWVSPMKSSASYTATTRPCANSTRTTRDSTRSGRPSTALHRVQTRFGHSRSGACPTPLPATEGNDSRMPITRASFRKPV